MWENGQNGAIRYDDEQLENEIFLSWKRFFFLDGPSGCGKTRFLKQLKLPETRIIPFSDISEGLREHLGRKEPFAKFQTDMDRKYPCKVLGMEDIDISLAGRPLTQLEISILLDYLGKNRKIILTGIDLEQRCGALLQAVGDEDYELFHYVY